MIGQTFGQYRVLERLGQGGMGSVYRAADDLLGREVALKILETTMEGADARFRAEAAALARLSHPGIAAVYELVEDDARLMMAMEFVRGQSLQQILEQVGVFSARRAADLCMQALAALEHAHASGVVHRDLKPANLMLTEGGAVKIMDFGIARREGAVNLTSAGARLGTPAYMAPEQVLGHAIDARADLYAMGIVFFRLVTAALPFSADTPFDMAQAQVNDPPAHARDLRPDLPDWVDAILARALAKKPGDRFQSAADFREALGRAGAGANQPAEPGVVEATEVMVRPDFDSAAAVAQTDYHARATTGRGAPGRRPWTPWLTAGAAAALAGAVWMVAVRRAGVSDPAATMTAARLESTAEPLYPSDLTPPSSRGASPDAAAAVASAALSSDAAADRRTRPAKPPTPPPAEALPLVSFSHVKRLLVNGGRTSTSDVVVQLSDSAVTVQPADGKTPAAMLSYQRLAKVTYVQARDPKWDPALSGPGEKIDLPGILGRARRWLVLQGADSYVVLRLDGDDWPDIMNALEARARVVIDRSGTKRPD